MEEKEFYAKLGERCKSLREKKHISVNEVVNKTGLSRSLLYEFETSGKKISAFRLNRLMKVLGISSIEDNLYPEKKKSTNGMKQRLRQLVQAFEETLEEMDNQLGAGTSTEEDEHHTTEDPDLNSVKC